MPRPSRTIDTCDSLAIVPFDRHLDDAQALLTGDGQHFDVERPAVDGHERKDGSHGRRR